MKGFGVTFRRSHPPSSRIAGRWWTGAPAAEVREKFCRVTPPKEISVIQRGGTLDVLNIVRRIVSVSARLRRDKSEGRAPRDPNISHKSGRRGTPPSDSFTTADDCVFTRELEQLHPDNRHVRDNPVNNAVIRGGNPSATPCRRDAGLLLHVGSGLWRLP